METLKRIEKIALIIGIVGLLFAGFGMIQGLMKNESRLVVSWLIGFSIWYSLAIGMLFLVMIWHIFDAGWAVIIRRQVEHGLSVFPWLGLIFVPLVLIGWFYKENPGIVWSWMNPQLLTPDHAIKIADDPIYLHKAGFLNMPFFTIRVIFYFTFFTFLSNRLRYYSFSLDHDADPAKVKKSEILLRIGNSNGGARCNIIDYRFLYEHFLPMVFNNVWGVVLCDFNAGSFSSRGDYLCYFRSSWIFKRHC